MTVGSGDPWEKSQNEGQQPSSGGYEPPPIEQTPAYGGYPSSPPPPGFPYPPAPGKEPCENCVKDGLEVIERVMKKYRAVTLPGLPRFTGGAVGFIGYEFIHDVEPVKVGLVLHPTIDMAAASPDRLVGDDGLIEIKCPNSSTHIATLLGKEIDADYLKQIHWQMRCTGRAWCRWRAAPA